MIDMGLKGMNEIEEKIQKIFRQAVARALGAMDIEKSSIEVKNAVKSTFWDTMRTVMNEIKREG